MAVEAKEDAAEALDSVWKLGVCALTSGELQQVATQLFLAVRDAVADRADVVSDAAAAVQIPAEAVAEAVRPSDDERATTLLLQEIPQKAVETVEQTTQKFKEAREQAHDSERTETSSTSQRHREIEGQVQKLMLVIEGLQNDPSYIEATQTLLDLGNKYAGQLSALQTSISSGEATAAVRAEVKGTADSARLETNEHVSGFFTALKELLEGLAGGASLLAIQQQAFRTLDVVLPDQDFTSLFRDAGNVAQQVIQEAKQKASTEGELSAKADSLRDAVRDLITRLHDLVESKPSARLEARQLLRLVNDFRKKIQENTKNQSLWTRAVKIWQVVKGVARGGVSAAKADWKDFVSDVFGAILPSVLDIVQSIPVPR